MADRRLIAGSITRSGQVRQLITRCGPWAGLLFSWAIPEIDDDSRLDGSPDQLHGLIFGRYPEVSVDQLAEMLGVMNDIDLAVWYEVIGSPGERYLYFPRFTTHQTLREDRYGPSRFPAPPGWVPEEGHPYAKNTARMTAWKPGQPEVRDLRREKPVRDNRKTVRVAKRPLVGGIKGDTHSLSTVAQPQRDHDATTARPERDRLVPSVAPGGDGRRASPRLATSRLDAPRLATAQGTSGLRPNAAVRDTDPRAAWVAAKVRELTDLSADLDWPRDRPAPGMFTDGRVRDRYGVVHASWAVFAEWARTEAVRLAEVEFSAPPAPAESATAADASADQADALDEPPIPDDDTPYERAREGA